MVTKLPTLSGRQYYPIVCDRRSNTCCECECLWLDDIYL